jgi:predicted anti-sigma-YlaC factor YlaD
VKPSTRTAGIHCPIAPETLLADIQGELSIEEARDVQNHIRECATCQARSQQLRSAYEQVAMLADEDDVPVADVRGIVLRDSQGHLRAVRLARGLNLSVRSLLISIAAIIAIMIILIATVARTFLRENIFTASRSQNTLTHVIPVGQGYYYAETVKLIPVKFGGVDWDLGEIVMVAERTGQVVRSLPASSQSPFKPELGIGSGTNVRPALTSDGKMLIEAAITADGHSPNAFALIDSVTGNVRYIKHLNLPSNVDPHQAEPIVHQLWVSGDNTTIYVLTKLAVSGQQHSYILSFNLADGTQNPDVVPPVDAGSVLGGLATIVSPDGKHLYDVVPAQDAQGKQGSAITFISLVTHQIEARLFIPDATQLPALGISPDNSQLFFFAGDSSTLYFISIASQSVTVSIPLIGKDAGVNTSSGDSATDMVLLSVSPDGRTVVVGRDKTLASRHAYDVWTIDVIQQTFFSYTQLRTPLQDVDLSSNGTTALLLGGEGNIQALPLTAQPIVTATTTDNTNSQPTPTPLPLTPQGWLTLADSTAVIQLIGGYDPVEATWTPTPVATATSTPILITPTPGKAPSTPPAVTVTPTLKPATVPPTISPTQQGGVTPQPTNHSGG